MSDDLSYFAMRATEERRLAMASPHANARKSHLEMAARYSALVGKGLARGTHTEAEQKTA